MMLHTEPGLVVCLSKDYKHNKWTVTYENKEKNQAWTFETCNAAIKAYNEIVKGLDRNG